MSPIDVIDLLSSSDEDGESPSKLLKSFNVPTNTSTARTTQQRKANSGSNSFEERKSSSVNNSGRGSSVLSSRLGDGFIGARNGHNHVQPLPNVTHNGFKTGTLPTYPQGFIGGLPMVDNTRQTEHSVRVENNRQSFTPPVLSKEAWNALGTPGRKLQQDLARIQRDLDTSRRQSEPQRVARIDKAVRYQQQRRLSSEVSHSAKQDGLTSLAAARPNAPLHGYTAPSRPAIAASKPVQFSVLSQRRPADVPLSNSKCSATIPVPGSAALNPLKPEHKLEENGSEGAANSFIPAQVSGFKRAPEAPLGETDPVKRQRFKAHSSAQIPAQLVDVTDATIERFSTSSEPEPEAHASSHTREPTSITSRLPLLSLMPSATVNGTGHKSRWTSEEDALLRKLKETDALDWDTIIIHFPGRSKGSTKVRYYTHVKNQNTSTVVGALATGLPVQQPTPPNSWMAPQTQTQPEGDIVKHDPLADDVLLPNLVAVSPTGPKKSSGQYTAADNALLKTLKEIRQLKWPEIHAYFPGRSLGSLQVHYSTKVKAARLDLSKVTIPSQASTPNMNASQAEARHSIPANRPVGNFGSQYTTEEVALLKRLKDEHLDWQAMVPYFNGRTAGSLQVYWYTKIKQGGLVRQAPSLHQSDSQDHVRSKRSRKSGPTATDGFVSWTDARKLMRDGVNTEDDRQNTVSNASTSGPPADQDNAFPHSIGRILRQREVGSVSGARAWTSSRCTLLSELKNQVYKDYRLQQYYHGTSGDVVGLSWSSTGKNFAAGSIAITDNSSMQYNMSRNLLIGDYKHGQLQELVEHHVPRPIVDETDNPNALGAMRHTQDPRLFMTVTATAFSPVPSQESCLFTTGTDCMLRKYSVEAKVVETRVQFAAKHAASVDLLAVHREGVIATGCHSASDSINVFKCSPTSLEKVWTGSPKRQDLQTTASIFPSSLKWGEAHMHRNFLLAGFSGDSSSSAEDKQLAGETALWDMEHQKQIELKGTIRNVFDVCWNPRPSSSSIVFAVASNATGMNFSRGMRTAVSCFAPGQPLSAVVRWQCPALDINDVLVCPHNDHLVAAGATDGRVYVWDQRWAGAGQAPLYVLAHGDSLNVLPHGYDRELTDTGVRFLSWGTTSSRLYSGSSDGVVKVWNPYRSTENAHEEDIDVPRQHRSAIMSGTFSPDHRELLVGTENGRINLFKIGGLTGRPQQFKLHTAPEPNSNSEHPFGAADALMKSGAIAFRRCGAMPITQAVQGQSYQGPYQAPSQLESALAENRLQQVLSAQADLAATRAQEGHVDPFDPVMEKAQIRVREAQAAVVDVQERANFAEQSNPRAEAFQRSLIQARREHEDLLTQARERFGDDAGSCKLECAHLTTSEEIEDNGRSDLRIPGILRAIGSTGVAVSRLQEEDEQSAEHCSRCSPLQARFRGVKRELCFTCKLEGMRLTTVCSMCSAPARVEPDENRQVLCEACAFTCFRCEGTMAPSKCSSLITCGTCNLTWSAGVLGYELVTNLGSKKAIKEDSPFHEQYDDFGSIDRERLADNCTNE